MTELRKFQCDITGELYGARNAGDGVMEIPLLKRHSTHPLEVKEVTRHVSNNYLAENIEGEIPTDLVHVGVIDWTVKGICIKSEGRFKEQEKWISIENKESGKYYDFLMMVEDHLVR